MSDPAQPIDPNNRIAQRMKKANQIAAKEGVPLSLNPNNMTPDEVMKHHPKAHAKMQAAMGKGQKVEQAEQAMNKAAAAKVDSYSGNFNGLVTVVAQEGREGKAIGMSIRMGQSTAFHATQYVEKFEDAMEEAAAYYGILMMQKMEDVLKGQWDGELQHPVYKAEAPENEEVEEQAE